MENLAIHYPEHEIRSDEFLFIQRNDPLFDKLCRHFPPPEYLIISCKTLVERDVPTYDMARLYKQKADAQLFFENKLKHLDETVHTELTEAGIPCKILEQRNFKHSEVPSMYVGELLDYHFERAWRYWTVKKNITLLDKFGYVNWNLAMKIYNDPVGNKVIRTNGHAGNMSPDNRIPVTGYHIDTQEGLNRFVEFITNG